MTKNEFETGQYLDLGGERIYSLTFRSATPAAWVVLCGPFPSDRLYSLGAWTKWARYLAERDIAAVRFDYSGTGESTGRFEDQDFDKWLRDIEWLAAWAAGQAGGRPVILHGLGMGGLLAQHAFAAGRGDGLLMWSPPQQGLDVLKQGLMLRLSMDMLLFRMPDRKSAKDYIQDLKSGGTVQIDGYSWSGALWTTGERLALDKAYASPGEGVEEGSGRPWRHVVLDGSLSPLVKSQSMLRAMNPRAAIVPSAPLNRDFTGFFEPNAAWIRGSAENQMIAGRHA
jgi:hypothetical protein